ncbi:hypothetical protein EUGRSUZ_L01784 [Eucalyptus grandis]|uniref:non-specific serine/threonine protein kinase n=1 Tax=Eucalyptus grandis TaxID=71139 RepID=A0A058ZSA8_EUCGR|nr:hypothetical protein EUGRSUZ_L01784 [Eucalyptus grandis]
MGCFKFFTLYVSVLFLLTAFRAVVSGDRASDSQIMSDRASLVSFMSGIVSDPGNVLQSWNSSDIHVCNWTGVTCNSARSEIVMLDLSGRSLGGTISPAIAGLSKLIILDLSRNFFGGRIPPEMGSLVELQQLSLTWNFLEGTIPSELGSLRKLVYLNLGINKLSGDIPEEIFCNGSSVLEYVDLSDNTLTGKIPLRDECELGALKYLLLWSNRLVGPVPPALANSTRLMWLDLESNMLSGELPSGTVHKMPHLQYLYLSYNDFASHDGNTNLGPFFSALANSSNLQELELAANKLGGEIPANIGDLPGTLQQFHLDENLIYGSIPPQISNLINLILLNLSSNFLNGTIPTELCRMQRLEGVYLSNNSLSGGIPSALGDLPHLGLLDLSRNSLSGLIPDCFANISQLRRLLLYKNQLSGMIPPSLAKCVNLEILDLSHNGLSGTLHGVAGMSSLKIYLNLASNYLHGALPLGLSQMDMVLAIDLSSNNLSGTIPSQLGGCIALEYLNLSGNILEGPLPSSIGQLPHLRALDVSSNHLIGVIPQSLQASPTLKQLNFSFNSFSGNVSDDGAFAALTEDSFLGNSGLCGSIKGMKACKKRRHYHLIIVPILLSLVATPIFCIFGYLALKSKIRQKLMNFSGSNTVDEKKEDSKEHKFPRILYRQLLEATGGFNPSSLIGSGHFGHVYKGVLQDNTRIAVKVFDSKTAGGISGTFKRECQVYKRTRHRNLMRIITICSRPDFKALVLPLKSNGSLDRHLYPSHQLNQGLDLVQLVGICSDVAEGLAYLHHHCPVRVVHCDLKPSNILLDDDMTAVIADFGIARLVKGGDKGVPLYDSASFSSTNGLLHGSVGYIAPENAEYGMGTRASSQGDVFSFGVLLLEIVTGVRPTDVPFHECSSLHEWVKSHYPHNLDPIVQKALSRCSSPSMSEHLRKACCEVIVELIELGLMCTQYSPSTRPSMMDMANEMSRLKKYLSDPS